MEGEEKKPLLLPDPEGQIVQQQEKVYVPAKEYPEVSCTMRFPLQANFICHENSCFVLWIVCVIYNGL